MQRKSLSIGIVALAAICGFARADEGRTSFLHFGKVDREAAGSAKQCEFEFTLWDAPEGGERVGKTLIYDGWEANKARVPVDQGYFEVVLDFGVEIYDDEPVYVESRCACGRNAKWRTVSRVAVTEDLLVEDDRLEVVEDPIESVKPLHPRRPIQIAEVDDPGESGGTFNNTLEAADGDPSPAVEVDADGNTSMVGDLTVGGAIKIDGDNNPLEIHVNGTRALRFEYADALSEAPNVIGGSPSNTVVPQKAGAVIAGGGSDTAANQVSEDWGTVSGGRSNHAFGMFGTVSGGSGNTAVGERSTVSGGQGGDALGKQSTVGGGNYNKANGDQSTVAGGNNNWADGVGSTVGGGALNSAAGDAATVPGGFLNEAAGNYTFAGGLRAKARHTGSFVWGDSQQANFASTGNNQFLIRAAGGVGIGANSPGAALDVSGDILADDRLLVQGTTPMSVVQDGSHSIVGMQAVGNALNFGRLSGNDLDAKLYIHGGGNVGIGTDIPTTPLAILGNGAANPVGITQNVVGGSSTMELTTSDSSGNQASRIVLRGGSGGDTADIEFYTGARGAEAQTMIIDGSTGDATFTGDVHTDGTIHVDGTGAGHSKPFYFKRYNVGETWGYNTGIPEAHWICSIAGWDTANGDIRESGVRPRITACKAEVNNEVWKLYCDFASHNTHEDWTVDMWCVRRSLAESSDR